MENKNKDIILKKIDELISLIKKTDDYQRYLFLKEEMKKNDTLMGLIIQIKKEEQIRIKKEYNHEDITENNEIVDKLNNELLGYPIYQEYLYLQEDINNELQNIRKILEDSFNK